MKLHDMLASFSAPKGVTSILAGLSTGDSSVLPHQNALTASREHAEQMVVKYDQAINECKSDWAYWSIMADKIYWEASLNILKGAELVGADNMPDIPFEDKGGVVMDAIFHVQQYGESILAECTKLSAKAES